MPENDQDFIPTRRSLISRLRKVGDDGSWEEFFECYGKLIYRVARKSGLIDAEAQDVVQETIMSVTRNISGFVYAPERGTFKGWLYRMARWRIADQFRKRDPARYDQGGENSDVGMLEAIPDPNGLTPAEQWDEQWERNVLELALERLKLRVDPKNYQYFDLTYVHGWSAARVASTLKVSPARVYLARHRLRALLGKELRAVRDRMSSAPRQARNRAEADGP